MLRCCILVIQEMSLMKTGDVLWSFFSPSLKYFLTFTSHKCSGVVLYWKVLQKMNLEKRVDLPLVFHTNTLFQVNPGRFTLILYTQAWNIQPLLKISEHLSTENLSLPRCVVPGLLPGHNPQEAKSSENLAQTLVLQYM